MIGKGMAKDEEQLRDWNRAILRLADELGKPCCATGDVHFLEPEDEAFRRILMAGQGFGDADNQAPLYLSLIHIYVVSCPTCGRTRIDLIGIAREVERRCMEIRGKRLKVAVMGCAVNGPGEAREADLGIAGGDGVGLLFRRGEIIKMCIRDSLCSTGFLL